jgi:hypothetical protein
VAHLHALLFAGVKTLKPRHSIICFMSGAVRANQISYAVRLLLSITVIEYNEI